MGAFLRVVRDIALLIARIVTGVVLIAHGWSRWQITGIESQISVLEAAGLPAARGLVIAATTFEIVGGILLILGLATPVVGFGIVVMNVAIILTTKAGASFFVNVGGWEYNAILATMGLVLLACGSGRAGLDHLFLKPAEERA